MLMRHSPVVCELPHILQASIRNLVDRRAGYFTFALSRHSFDVFDELGEYLHSRPPKGMYNITKLRLISAAAAAGNHDTIVSNRIGRKRAEQVKGKEGVGREMTPNM